MMDTVDNVKERIAELADTNRRLADDLNASQSAIAKLERERAELLGKLEYSDRELTAAQDEWVHDRRKASGLVREREALIRDLDAARRQLLSQLRATKTKTEQAEQRVEEISLRLRAAEQARDEAISELGQVTAAFVDIRDQLRASLDEVTHNDAAAYDDG